MPYLPYLDDCSCPSCTETRRQNDSCAVCNFLASHPSDEFLFTTERALVAVPRPAMERLRRNGIGSVNVNRNHCHICSLHSQGRRLLHTSLTASAVRLAIVSRLDLSYHDLYNTTTMTLARMHRIMWPLGRGAEPHFIILTGALPPAHAYPQTEPQAPDLCHACKAAIADCECDEFDPAEVENA